MTLEDVRRQAMAAVFEDKSVSPLEYSVYGAILDNYTERDGRPCVLSNAEIGYMVGIHQSTASKAIRNLVRCGHLVTVTVSGLRLIRPSAWRYWPVK